MAGKTRSSSSAEDFTKHLDNYIKNSEAFKNAIVAAVRAAVFPLQDEITNLKAELAKLKSDLLGAGANARMCGSPKEKRYRRQGNRTCELADFDPLPRLQFMVGHVIGGIYYVAT